MWNDLAFCLYAAIAVVSFYGFGLFLWWYFKHQRRATAVYVYVMGLLLGVFLNFFTSAFVRSFRSVDPQRYTDMHDTWWWEWRMVIILVCALAISLHMSYRAFVKKIRPADPKDVREVTPVEVWVESDCKKYFDTRFAVIETELIDVKGILAERKERFKKFIEETR